MICQQQHNNTSSIICLAIGDMLENRRWSPGINEVRPRDACTNWGDMTSWSCL